MSNFKYSKHQKHMDLFFLHHLCFFWTLGNINNHITEKSQQSSLDQHKLQCAVLVFGSKDESHIFVYILVSDEHTKFYFLQC